MALWHQPGALEQGNSSRTEEEQEHLLPTKVANNLFPAARPKLLNRTWKKSISLLETTICPKDTEEQLRNSK